MKSKLFILFISICLLSGCVSSDSVVSIGRDGTVNFNNRIIFDEDAYDTFTSSIDYISDSYKYNGYEVNKINEDGIYGFEITKKFGNLNNLKYADDSTSKSNILLYPEVVNKRLFSSSNYIFLRKYSASFRLSLDEEYISDLESLFNSSSDEVIDRDSAKLLRDNANFTFSISNYHKVINNNCDSFKDGVCIFNIKYGDSKNVVYDFIVINYNAIAYVIIILFFVIIYAFANYKRNVMFKKSSKISIYDSLREEAKIYKNDEKNKEVKNKIDNRSKNIDSINKRKREL